MKKQMISLVLATALAASMVPACAADIAVNDSAVEQAEIAVADSARESSVTAASSAVFLVKGTAAKTKITYEWTKAAGAAKYEVYQARFGRSHYELIRTTSGNKYTEKGLKSGKSFKTYVIAYDSNGKKLQTSPISYVQTLGGKKSNASAVSAASDLSLKADQSASVEAKIAEKDQNKTLLFRKIHYYSSDESVASVNAKGKVTANGEGSAVIYSAAPSGVYAETNVTVEAKYYNGEQIGLDPSWKYAENSKINSGYAVMYKAEENRKNIIVGVNAGHGTKGGSSVKTLSHPDGSPKIVGGTTAAGAIYSTAVSSGMDFNDGTEENVVTLQMAQLVRDKLLAQGYDVLMVRDEADVQLDNVARTVICNNVADCHIALHWDDDDDYPDGKGCFYVGVAGGLKTMEPVASTWKEDNALGEALIDGLESDGYTIFNGGHRNGDLTQISYSSVPSVDIELGDETSDHSTEALDKQADALVKGINLYFYNK